MINKLTKESFRVHAQVIAINELAKNAKFHIKDGNLKTMKWFDDDIKKPTIEDIEKRIDELWLKYNLKSYQYDRADAYDPIPEQLDQIYHDIDGWKAKIKAVKDKYPKP